jgi:hypothetical protein
MAGAILERELRLARTGHLRFDIATPADDAGIRRLLRENPTRGQITISLEREPNYFADAALRGENKLTIVARENGCLICAGSCTTRWRFVNGKAQRIGYLGGLRLDVRHSGRFDILRRGYRCFRELQVPPADLYFTSIAADNQRARKFLERGLPGMPLYHFLEEFVTLLVPTIGPSQGEEQDTRKPGPNGSFAAESTADELAAFLTEHNRSCQLAPLWSEDDLRELRPLGLSLDDFCCVRRGGQLVGCGALWDQRSFKQTVIRDYAPWLAFARPLINAGARFTRRAQLPGIGETLAGAFVSHLAVPPAEPNVLVEIIEELRRRASQRGIEFLTLGFAARDPRLKTVHHKFRGRSYRSRIYVVRWPGMAGPACELGQPSGSAGVATASSSFQEVLAPEVALL